MLTKAMKVLDNAVDENIKELRKNKDAASGPKLYTITAKKHSIGTIHIDGINEKGTPDKVLGTKLKNDLNTFAGHKIPKE